MAGLADILQGIEEDKIRAAWEAEYGVTQPQTPMPIEITHGMPQVGGPITAAPPPVYVPPPEPIMAARAPTQSPDPYAATDIGNWTQPYVSPLEMRTPDPYAGMFDQVAMQGGQAPAPQTPMPQAQVPQAPAIPQAPGEGYQAGPRGVQAMPPATAEEFQARVSGWERFKQALSRPDVIGPLQTFFSAIAAPLAPGENMGSRMGRASMMAQLHQKMLQDNEKNAEYNLQVQRAELQTKQADLKGKQLKNTKDEEGMASELAQQYWTANKIATDAQNAQAEFEDKLKNTKSRREYEGRLPAFAPDRSGSSGSDLSGYSDNDLARAYWADFVTPYFKWAETTKTKNPDSNFSHDQWMIDMQKDDVLYRKYRAEMAKRGMKVDMRQPGSGEKAQTPAKKSYKLGADGKLQ